MKMEDGTSLILKIGVVISFAMILMGVIASLFVSETDSTFIMRVGVGILICTPMAGILASLCGLLRNNDRKYIAITLVLILIIVIGVVLAWLQK